MLFLQPCLDHSLARTQNTNLNSLKQFNRRLGHLEGRQLGQNGRRRAQIRPNHSPL